MINSFFRSKSATYVALDDHLVILNTENGKYYSLNSSAARFFLELPIAPDDYDDQLVDQNIVEELLDEILEPMQAGARVMILDMLNSGLLKVNPETEKATEDYFEGNLVQPSVSHWGTVATNTLVAGG